MIWKPLIGLAFCACAASASAETLQFETDTGVVIVRSYDQYGTAVVEFIGAAGAMYQCVAMNASGTPIATASAMADMGQILIQGVNAQDIDAIKCRRTF